MDVNCPSTEKRVCVILELSGIRNGSPKAVGYGDFRGSHRMSAGDSRGCSAGCHSPGAEECG